MAMAIQEKSLLYYTEDKILFGYFIDNFGSVVYMYKAARGLRQLQITSGLMTFPVERYQNMVKD